MLCLRLLLLAILALSALAQVLFVDGNSSASNSTACGNRSSPCPSLEAALKNKSVIVHILSSTLTLSQPIVLENSATFHLRGHDPDGTLITCSKKLAGLIFTRLDNVTISSVRFSGCGAVRTYTVYPGTVKSYSAVIHLHWCKDVNITNLNASHNHGAGIAIIDPLGGTMTISYSHFTNNHVPERDLMTYEGGTGIYVRVRGSASEREPLLLRLFNCTFENNRATFMGVYSVFNVYNQPHTGTGRGGGVDILLWNNSSWSSVEITDCFFFNNTAYLGGGLAIQLCDDSSHNSIRIEHCVFEYNGCVKGLRTGSGGGAHFGYSFNDNKELESLNNSFVIRNSIYRENCAELGGGMTFFTSRSRHMEASLSNTFLSDNCSWIGNMAHIGAAVDASPHVEIRAQKGFLPTLVFKDCSFVHNHVAFQQQDLYQSFGSGTLFSSLFNIDFVGSVHFENNTGSALVIVNAIANLTLCDAIFVKNTGVQGGAISLIGVSALVIGPERNYNFTDNRASDRGGAIYNYLVDDHDFVASRSCFFYYSEYDVHGSEWNLSFYFINNTAGTYGHSIFSSSILPCMQVVPAEQLYNNHTWNPAMIFRWPDIFYYDNRTENQIATEGGSIISTEPLPFLVIPGDKHELSILTTDDIGQEINTTFRASMVGAGSDGIQVDESSSCLSTNVIQLKGHTGNTGVLLLETVTSRKNSIVMNVILQPCPPGFMLTGNECTCDTDTYIGIVSCDLKGFRAIIKRGYWAGYVENDTFVTGICPLAFCGYNDSSYKREVALPKVTSADHLDEYVCGPTRTGILCGSCKQNYSVFYHSPSYSCHKSNHCELGWLFYILSELVPVTVTFVIILALNISFTSGRVSGFILFSQLLDSVVVNGSGVVQYPETLSILSWGYQLIYGVFTMEFFNIEPLSFCLWDGATVLDVLAFRYVTIVYAFLLVLLTLLFLKYRGHAFVGRYVRITTIKTSVIHGLSAFIVLCYAQTTKVSIYILISGFVHGKDGEILSSRVLFDGDSVSYSPDHLPYVLPAITCLLTVSTIPPALLLLYPSMNKIPTFLKLSDNKVVRGVVSLIAINKLKPFLDSFQGCFRDDLRFFAGIYFLYRWIALLIFVLVPTMTDFYMSLSNAYILVLMLHAVFQPYASRAHNIIDGCLFANLALIYSIAGYNYLFSQGLIETYSIQTTYITTTASIQLILIYLPIVVMAVYLSKLLFRKSQTLRRKRVVSEYVVVQPPRRTIVTSTDIDDLLDGPEEFPARMLETNYDQHRDLSSPSSDVFEETSN